MEPTAIIQIQIQERSQTNAFTLVSTHKIRELYVGGSPPTEIPTRRLPTMAAGHERHVRRGFAPDGSTPPF